MSMDEGPQYKAYPGDSGLRQANVNRGMGAGGGGVTTASGVNHQLDQVRAEVQQLDQMLGALGQRLMPIMNPKKVGAGQPAPPNEAEAVSSPVVDQIRDIKLTIRGLTRMAMTLMEAVEL